MDYQKIAAGDDFERLRRQRARLRFGSAAILLLLYFGYCIVGVLAPDLWARAVRPASVLPLGYYVGQGIILLGIVVAIFYVYRANSKFERMERGVRERVKDQ